MKINKDSKNYWGILPEEIRCRILWFVESKDLHTCACLNKRWQGTIDNLSYKSLSKESYSIIYKGTKIFKYLTCTDKDCLTDIVDNLTFMNKNNIPWDQFLNGKLPGIKSVILTIYSYIGEKELRYKEVENALETLRRLQYKIKILHFTAWGEPYSMFTMGDDNRDFYEFKNSIFNSIGTDLKLLHIRGDSSLLSLLYLDIYKNLKKLCIQDCQNLKNIKLKKNNNIKAIELRLVSLDDISFLCNTPGLKELTVEMGQNSSVDLSPIGRCLDLESLSININNRNINAEAMETIGKCIHINRLKITVGCKLNELSFKFINKLEKLESFELYFIAGSGKTEGLQNLKYLENCKQLNKLVLLGVHGLIDISSVKHLSNLEEIRISSLSLKNIECLKSCKRLLIIDFKESVMINNTQLTQLKQALPHIEEISYPCNH